MSDFSRPEYASYVQLCRELGFGNKWEQVDDLPTLADWLEMLEATEVVGTARDYYIRVALAAFDDIYIISAVWPSESLAGEGPTREEAAARLYQAVKKD